MLAPGLLIVLSNDLGASVPQAALTITIAAIAMCFGSPILATLTSDIDRRTVLAGSLALYAVGHAVCAFAPNLTVLIGMRSVTLLGAAVFTPQAAATLGLVIAPERRAAAITAVFLGWSVASVIGTPAAAWLGAHIGWRWTFGAFAMLCVVGIIWVYRVVPRGLRGVPLSREAWFRDPASRVDCDFAGDSGVCVRAIYDVCLHRAVCCEHVKCVAEYAVVGTHVVRWRGRRR